MNLNEELKRIKSLMFEQTEPCMFQTTGEINSPYGFTLCLYSPKDEKIGQVEVIDFINAVNLSEKFTNCMEKNDGTFGDDTVYMFNLEVDENFRRQGYAEKIYNELEKILKQNNFKYTTGIIDDENQPSLNLHNKLGYQKFSDWNGKQLHYKQI